MAWAPEVIEVSFAPICARQRRADRPLLRGSKKNSTEFKYLVAFVEPFRQ